MYVVIRLKIMQVSSVLELVSYYLKGHGCMAINEMDFLLI